MAVVERKTKAGRTVTVQQYTRPGKHIGKRERKGEGTSPAQKEGNIRRAVMKLTWLMNANFSDGDLLVTVQPLFFQKEVDFHQTPYFVVDMYHNSGISWNFSVKFSLLGDS